MQQLDGVPAGCSRVGLSARCLAFLVPCHCHVEWGICGTAEHWPVSLFLRKETRQASATHPVVAVLAKLSCRGAVTQAGRLD